MRVYDASVNATPEPEPEPIEDASVTRRYTRVDHARLAALLADGASPSDAARALDVDRSSIYRALEAPELMRELAVAAGAVDATVDVGTIGGLQAVASWLRDRILAPLPASPADTDDVDEQLRRARVMRLEASSRAQLATAYARVGETMTRAQERRDALRSRTSATSVPAQQQRPRGLRPSA